MSQTSPVTETADIVERIRARIMSHGGPAKDANGAYIGTVWPMLLEAADEIEALRHDLDRHIQIAADCMTGVAQTPADTRLQRLLREARQYVSDAFINDDMEVHRHSMSLLKDIDAALSDTSTGGNGK